MFSATTSHCLSTKMAVIATTHRTYALVQVPKTPVTTMNNAENERAKNKMSKLLVTLFTDAGCFSDYAHELRNVLAPGLQ